MKQWVRERLICPECLADEVSLDLVVEKADGDDVRQGHLSCPACRRSYPIQNGVAVVLPAAASAALSETSGYNSKNMLSAYLWSHFCDFLNDPQATHAYQIWSSFFKNSDGDALDIGCSVGRLSLELSKTHHRVIGIDTSISFVKKARDLLWKKSLDFDLIIEGFITENRTCAFDAGFNYENVDFLVADALALPFPERSFNTVISINLLEKVTNSLRHLKDINRVMKEKESMFVFSDPFSWDENFSDPKTWLSGGLNGNGSCRGLESIRRYFTGKDHVFDPPLEVVETSNVPWKIRKTRNLWEHINSECIVGAR